MDVARIRADLPVTQRLAYFNTGWDGPTPLPVVRAIQRELEEESEEGPTAPPVLERIHKLEDEARATAARLLNATAAEVSLQDNTTAGINIVVSGLDWRAGDEALTFSLEHPSGLVPLYFACDRHGIGVSIVPVEAGGGQEAVLERMRRQWSPRVRLVLVSHILYNSGMVMPLREIADFAHGHGATVLVDAAQGPGQVPVDVRALDCDYYAMPGHKWLLGPDGVGALYVREALIPSVRPTFVSSSATTEHDALGHYRPSQAITKFELTTSSTPLLVGLARAIQYLEGFGWNAVHGRIAALAADAKRRLSEVPGVEVVTPISPKASGGLVTFRAPSAFGGDPRPIYERLWAEHIVARTVKEVAGVRLSIHAFNTEAEIERAVEVVRKAVTGTP